MSIMTVEKLNEQMDYLETHAKSHLKNDMAIDILSQGSASEQEQKKRIETLIKISKEEYQKALEALIKSISEYATQEGKDQKVQKVLDQLLLKAIDQGRDLKLISHLLSPEIHANVNTQDQNGNNCLALAMAHKGDEHYKNNLLKTLQTSTQNQGEIKDSPPPLLSSIIRAQKMSKMPKDENTPPPFLSDTRRKKNKLSSENAK